LARFVARVFVVSTAIGWDMYNRGSFLKSYVELGGRFENLLSFLKMGAPHSSEVTNDQPPKRPN